MAQIYNVVDADGHILEPLTLWADYIDPAFRERQPRFVIDDNGKERLTVEGKLLGNPRGIGSLGAVGVRQGELKLDSLKYADGRKGGFDPHARIADMDLTGSTPRSSTRALACSPALSKIPAWLPRCVVPTIVGSRITASLILTGCSGSRCCRCSPSNWRWRS